MIRRFYLMRHPVTILLYFVAAAVLAMSTYDPVCAALSFFGSSISLFMLSGTRAFLRTFFVYLIMILLVALLNPFFSQRGLTVLFYVGGTPYTLEAVFFGVSASMSMISAIQWLNVLFFVLPRGRFLALFSKIAPVTASLVSMVFRYIPELLRKSRAITDSKKGLGVGVGGLKGAYSMSNALVSWSMEESLETADSMRARNYGKKKRSSAHDLSFSRSDRFELIVIIVFLCFGVVSVMRSTDFLFYPRIHFASHGFEIFGYGIYVLLPAILAAYEKVNELLRLKVSVKEPRKNTDFLIFYNPRARD